MTWSLGRVGMTRQERARKGRLWYARLAGIIQNEKLEICRENIFGERHMGDFARLL